MDAEDSRLDGPSLTGRADAPVAAGAPEQAASGKRAAPAT